MPRWFVPLGAMVRSALGLAPCVPLAAAAPLAAPLPVLETGFHTAMISRLDVADDGTLLTVSHDATARLWRRAGDGLALERVLRVPRDAGDDGKLYAGAITRDGRWVAVGGWTGHAWVSGHVVYLLERDSGRLAGRLGPHADVILRLRWRDDGSLAVCLAAGGIRVYRWPGGALLWQDGDYGDASYGACWLPDGGLVVTGYDGALRRYDAQGRRTARAATRPGQRPYAVAHDGRGTLLVGFSDAPAVARYRLADGGGLEELAPLDTAGVAVGNLMSVAWASGQWWAGGSYVDDPAQRLLRWEGEGPSRRAPGPDNSVLDLAAIAGGVAVAGADPQLLWLDGEGRVVARLRAATPDYREQDAVLAVGQDARQVRVGLSSHGVPVLLDLGAGTLSDSPEPVAGLATARLEARGWDWQAWRGAQVAVLNGLPIVLQPQDIGRSLAIAPDGALAVLGCEWSLRAVDRRGRERWQQAVPGTAWAVAVSGDGRSVVTAYGDGTLGWHRMNDGARYLTAFIHAEDRRWIAWTPSGYAWASPGGERLLLWHRNRGLDEAPETLSYADTPGALRPEVVAAAIEARDEAAALQRLGLPPASALVPPGP